MSLRPLSALETVALDTPARRATSSMVTRSPAGRPVTVTSRGVETVSTIARTSPADQDATRPPTAAREGVCRHPAIGSVETVSRLSQVVAQLRAGDEGVPSARKPNVAEPPGASEPL